MAEYPFAAIQFPFAVMPLLLFAELKDKRRLSQAPSEWLPRSCGGVTSYWGPVPIAIYRYEDPPARPPAP